jgi:hypothetical protein
MVEDECGGRKRNKNVGAALGADYLVMAFGVLLDENSLSLQRKH